VNGQKYPVVLNGLTYGIVALVLIGWFAVLLPQLTKPADVTLPATLPGYVAADDAGRLADMEVTDQAGKTTTLTESLAASAQQQGTTADQMLQQIAATYRSQRSATDKALADTYDEPAAQRSYVGSDQSVATVTVARTDQAPLLTGGSGEQLQQVDDATCLAGQSSSTCYRIAGDLLVQVQAGAAPDDVAKLLDTFLPELTEQG